MEISERWQRLPSEVLKLKQEKPIDYMLMLGKVLADDDMSKGNFDVNEPNENLDLFTELLRL